MSSSFPATPNPQVMSLVDPVLPNTLTSSPALATAVHLGQIWIIYPFRTDSSGNQGVAEVLYDLGPQAQDNIAIFSDTTQDGKFAYCMLAFRLLRCTRTVSS